MHYKRAYRVLILEKDRICGPFWYLPATCRFNKWSHTHDEMFGCSSIEELRKYFQRQFDTCYHECYEGFSLDDYVKELQWESAYVIEGLISGRNNRKSCIHKRDSKLAPHEICFRSFKPVKKVYRLMDLLNMEVAYGQH